MASSLKKSLIGIGRFLRLVDENEDMLSISNTAVIVVLTKVALSSSCNLLDIVALLGCLFNYYGKKHLNKNKSKLTDDNKSALDEMKAKLQIVQDKTAGIAAIVGMRNPIIKS